MTPQRQQPQQPQQLQPQPQRPQRPQPQPQQGPLLKPSLEEDRAKVVATALADVESRIGMKSVKEKFKSLIDQVEMDKMREEMGLRVPKKTHHLIFAGNPGTGKTTIARSLSKAYYGLGVTKKDEAVFVENPLVELVAGYVDQSAAKVEEVFQRAKGGVLFIDEFPQLVAKAEKGHGAAEALGTLMTLAENNRHDTVVIFAGYPEALHKLWAVDPGMKSRFPNVIDFPDYNASELTKIAGVLADDIGGLELDKAAQKKVADTFEARAPLQGNARDVRNIIDRAIDRQTQRLLTKRRAGKKIATAEARTLTAEDFKDL